MKTLKRMLRWLALYAAMAPVLGFVFLAGRLNNALYAQNPAAYIQWHSVIDFAAKMLALAWFLLGLALLNPYGIPFKDVFRASFNDYSAWQEIVLRFVSLIAIAVLGFLGSVYLLPLVRTELSLYLILYAILCLGVTLFMPWLRRSYKRMQAAQKAATPEALPPEIGPA